MAELALVHQALVVAEYVLRVGRPPKQTTINEEEKTFIAC